jgi:hypothetical protein
MSETRQTAPPPLQWGEYVASPLGPVDSTGRVRWRLVGPGVSSTMLWMTRDEARARVVARLRAWGLDAPEVQVAWSEMPPPPPPPPPPPRTRQKWARGVEHVEAELPEWAVTDTTRRLPACIIVACAAARYARGLCWGHYDLVCALGIKDRVGLPRAGKARGIRKRTKRG